MTRTKFWLICVGVWAVAGWTAVYFERRHEAQYLTALDSLENQVNILTTKQQTADKELLDCNNEFNDFVLTCAEDSQNMLRDLFHWGAIGVRCDDESCWLERPELDQGKQGGTSL